MIDEREETDSTKQISRRKFLGKLGLAIPAIGLLSLGLTGCDDEDNDWGWGDHHHDDWRRGNDGEWHREDRDYEWRRDREGHTWRRPRSGGEWRREDEGRGGGRGEGEHREGDRGEGGRGDGDRGEGDRR